jgi:hypothetical protein
MLKAAPTDEKAINKTLFVIENIQQIKIFT